jgi:hypothetical protein
MNWESCCWQHIHVKNFKSRVNYICEKTKYYAQCGVAWLEIRGRWGCSSTGFTAALVGPLGSGLSLWNGVLD